MSEIQIYLIVICSVWVLVDGLHDRWLRFVESYKQQERAERMDRWDAERNIAPRGREAQP